MKYIKVPVVQTVIDCLPLYAREGAPSKCRGGQNGAQVKHTFHPRQAVYTWVKCTRPAVDQCIDEAVRQGLEHADLGFQCKSGVDRSVAALNLVKAALVQNGYNVEAYHLTIHTQDKACRWPCCSEAHLSGPHGQEWEEVRHMFYDLWQKAASMPHDVRSESKVARGALRLQEQAACASGQNKGGVSIQTENGSDSVPRDFSPEIKAAREEKRLQEHAARANRKFMRGWLIPTGNESGQTSTAAAQATGSSSVTQPASAALPAFIPPPPPEGDGRWRLYRTTVTGRLWWHNLLTEECRWQDMPWPPPDGDGYWRLYRTPVTGKLWWHNQLTEECRWQEKFV
jgi:hypothetical protein